VPKSLRVRLDVDSLGYVVSGYGSGNFVGPGGGSLIGLGGCGLVVLGGDNLVGPGGGQLSDTDGGNLVDLGGDDIVGPACGDLVCPGLDGSDVDGDGASDFLLLLLVLLFHAALRMSRL
jgi:hypothetical protein